jgi:hypothetical protein
MGTIIMFYARHEVGLIQNRKKAAEKQQGKRSRKTAGTVLSGIRTQQNNYNAVPLWASFQKL